MVFKKQGNSSFSSIKQKVISPTSPAGKRGVKIVQDYDRLPISLVEVASSDALSALTSDPLVETVQPNRVVQLAGPQATGTAGAHMLTAVGVGGGVEGASVQGVAGAERGNVHATIQRKLVP